MVAEAKPGIPPIVSMPAAPPPAKKPESKPQGTASSGAAAAQGGDGQAYCSNIAPTVVEARFAWQAKRLAELEAQLKQRMSELDAKQAEYKTWLQKREEFQKKADSIVDGITERTEQVHDSLKATGESLILELDLRTTDLATRIEDAGVKLADQLANTGDKAVEQMLTVDQIAHTFAVYPSLSGSLTEAARRLMRPADDTR